MAGIYHDRIRPERGAHPSPTYKHGRNIEHDSRSLNYPAATALPGCRWWPWHRPTPKSKVWQPRIQPLNQGNLGSCTGNALVACLSAAPTRVMPEDLLTEALAVDVYSKATRLDEVYGQYPPTDTGSSGLAVMKVARNRGWISGYRHAFNLTQVITSLQSTPVIVGIAWKQAMYVPRSDGLVRYVGPVVGGHEICLYGIDLGRRLLTFRNSWGPGWGDGGDFKLTFDDFELALADQGDVTVPVWRQ